jgi:aryl-alcohol dehydrogenase-like predicted oxidoreductase
MEYRVLGKTGLKISRMGFGGIPIQRIDAEGTKVLMHKMVEAGINYIDTARAYTVSEEYLGYALEGIRDKFIIASKSMSKRFIYYSFCLTSTSTNVSMMSPTLMSSCDVRLIPHSKFVPTSFTSSL